MQTYFTLLGRDDMHSPWGVVFGDWDSDVVKEERADMNQLGEMPMSCLKIVQTDGTQVEIDDMVRHQNRLAGN